MERKYLARQKIYEENPIHGLLIVVFEDLAAQGLQDNLTVSSINGPLPSRLDVIPEWLKGDAKVLVDRILQTVFFETDGDEEWAFCILLDNGMYLYLYHFFGTGSYSCCRLMRIFYSYSWQLLLPHILPKHIPAQLPIWVKI